MCSSCDTAFFNSRSHSEEIRHESVDHTLFCETESVKQVLKTDRMNVANFRVRSNFSCWMSRELGNEKEKFLACAEDLSMPQGAEVT